MKQAKIMAPQQRPPMPKGTLLRAAKKSTAVFGKPTRFSKRTHESFMGTVGKNEQVMSLGEFASSQTKTWIRVLTSLGPGWVLVKDLMPTEEGT